MKVILTKDYEHLGEAGEIKEVKNGYASNYLIPNGIAKFASPSNLKSWEEERRQKRRKIDQEIEEAKTKASGIEGQNITLKVKTGEGGRVFGSVTAQMIHEALAEAGFAYIEKRKIILSEPIKTLGDHDVTIKLHTNVTANLKVKVKSENEAEQVENTSAEESADTSSENSEAITNNEENA